MEKNSKTAISTVTPVTQSEIELTVSNTIKIYLQNKNLNIVVLDVEDDLVATGVLDSFDAVSIIAELEDKFDIMINFPSDFCISVAGLSKLLIR